LSSAVDAPANAAASVEIPDVRLEEVFKRFDDVVAVDGISLEIPHGKFFALLGPSGCGKTTTLRMIGGFEEPTAGRIELGGKDVVGLPPYKRDVNTVFQSYALFPHLSVFENTAFGLRRKGVAKDQVRGRVNEMLKLVGLEGLGPRRPRQLSGGQQQRVALARALVNRPQVLLLDEPLGALDLKLRKQLQLELKALQHDLGITFVHVTHDQEEAMTMADAIAVMNRGRVEQLGPPIELYERPATAFVAGFLGVSNLLPGVVAGEDRVRLDDGTEIRVPLAGRTGPVAAGVRPEKIRVGAGGGVNELAGAVAETAYVGVATQLIVRTRAGTVSVYSQNTEAGAAAPAPGSHVTLSWSPEATFVVDRPEEIPA
jgi:spermidine/putrescine transport system ATP-binding protein